MTRIDLRIMRPSEGYYTSQVSSPGPCLWPLRTFLPEGYEPNYPYPLLVFLHGEGSSEEQVLRLAPRLSRRNYVYIALRGPHAVEPPLNSQESVRPYQAYSPTFDARSESSSYGAYSTNGYSWGLDGDGCASSALEEYVFAAISQTRRNLHIHSERIYLVGMQEGATLAYRLALLYPERFAGVLSLNGIMPRENRPLLRFPEIRSLKVMIGHGIANSVAPLGLARQDYRLFYTAGMSVDLSTYPTTHRIHPHMLRDANRWIQNHIEQADSSQ